MGFLSNKSGKRKKELQELATEKRTIIFYEAPHRVIQFLEQLYEAFGNRAITVTRELTKIHEEVLRGHVKELLPIISKREQRGEYVIIAEGTEKSQQEETIPVKLEEAIKNMLEDNLSIRDIADSISKTHNIRFRSAYREVLDLKRKMEGL
jgi:16S rRNA (cytidine1402-2'-O)-methyltransferase